MASIVWTVGARDDLREIVDYISRDSLAYAAATAERLLEAAEQLRQHPRLGRVVPEYKDQAIRELIVRNYRVVYRVRRQRVAVVALVHASRDTLRRVRKEPWDFR